MIYLKNVYKSYGETHVLKDVSFSLEKGQRAALVGPNGIGKSTLLKLITGAIEPSKGSIETHPNIRVAYLSQDMEAKGGISIEAYVNSYAGYEVPTYRIETMLHGFEMKDVVLSKKVEELSGGQKRKVALMAFLFNKADLYLLDEPTNNLDIASIVWLETYIVKENMTALIVSHDREFLDKVTDRIFSIDKRKKTLEVTRGLYSNFLIQEEKREKREKLEYTLDKVERERLYKIAERKKEEAKKGAEWQPDDNDKMLRGFKQNRAKKSAKTAQVVLRRIDRMEEKDVPLSKTPLSIPLDPEKEKGVADIFIRKVSYSYEHFTLKEVLLDIPYGSHITLVGDNGSGKSTLLKLISKRLEPSMGEVIHGSGVRIGELMQEHENLDLQKSVITFLKKHTLGHESELYNLLQKFGIDSDHARGTIGDLSSGMRVRMLLALCAYTSVNVLVLDEPTNHLDIEGIQALEELLKTYEGTVILVTHDRKLLEHVSYNRLYRMEKGEISKLVDYKIYLEENEKRAEKLIRMI